MIPVRGSLPPPPPPTWYGPKTCVLQHSAWKRCICSVYCMVGCWRGPQPCKFVGFLQPTFRKRVICNVSASTSWSSAAAPSSISVSNYHIILNLLLTVFSLGTGLISVYILCLSNFLLECLVFRNWSNQLHCCWLDDPHRFPGPTHSTGGRGVDVMTMTMAGGVGGGPGTWNIYAYTCIYRNICIYIYIHTHLLFRRVNNSSLLAEKISPKNLIIRWLGPFEDSANQEYVPKR